MRLLEKKQLKVSIPIASSFPWGLVGLILAYEIEECDCGCLPAVD
jgi:hypothetical protein